MTDYPPPPQSPQQPASGQPLSPSDERLYATLAHAGIILFGFLPPLIIWLVFRERSAYVDDQGKEALNFSILVTIAQVVSALLWIVLIGFLLSAVVGIATLVLCIMAAIAANRGDTYRYPLNWRIIK